MQICRRCGFEIEPGDSYEYVNGTDRQHQLSRCFDLVKSAAYKRGAADVTAELQKQLAYTTGERDALKALLAEALTDASKDLEALKAKVQ